MAVPLFKRSRKTALTEGVIAGTLFGTAAIFVRFLKTLNVFSIVFWRLVIASVTLIVIISVLKHPLNLDALKANILRISPLGILIGLHFILFVSSVRDTTILNATVLVNTAPIFSVLISTFLFKIKPSRLAVVGLTISFLGICLIAYRDAIYPLTINLKGDLKAILAALAEGFYLNYGREIRDEVSLLPMMILIYAISALTVGISYTLSGTPLILPNQLFPLLLLFGLGILPTALGHTLYFSSLSNLKPFETSTLALLEPIGATMLGIVLFSEIPNMFFVLGAAFVLGGVVLVIFK